MVVGIAHELGQPCNDDVELGECANGLERALAPRSDDQVLDQIDALLARAGTDKSQILMCQIFIADLADFPGMNAVWEKWVPAGHAPPRATVQAPLAQPQWRVEMVVTAAA